MLLWQDFSSKQPNPDMALLCVNFENLSSVLVSLVATLYMFLAI